MNTLYLCTSNVYNPNETHPTIRKLGRKVFQCEIWAENQEKALAVAKDIRSSEFPNHTYSEFSCEAQPGVTIDGNRESCQAIGKAYDVLPNGQVVIHDEDALRQLTLEQIRELPQDARVFVRLAMRQDEIPTDVKWLREYGTLLMKKKEGIITSISSASFPTKVRLREKRTRLTLTTLWSDPDGTFYNRSPSALLLLQVFTEQGEGKSLEEIERKRW